MAINERVHTKIDPKTGKEKFYIRYDDDKISPLYDWDEVNYKKLFEKLIKRKGPAGWWAYTHGIGFNPVFEQDEDADENEAILKARARYIGQESWYDATHFLWIKLPNEQFAQLAQIRVSNHCTKHDQWEKSHSNRRHINCDTCLNIIVGSTINRDPPQPALGNHLITSVEVEYDPSAQTDKERAVVDTFIKKVTDGLQPVVTLEQIDTMFNTNATIVRSMGGVFLNGNINTAGKIREKQFQNGGRRVFTVPNEDLGFITDKIPEIIDDTVPDWQTKLQQKKEAEEKAAKEAAEQAKAARQAEALRMQIPTEIPYSALDDAQGSYTNPKDGNQYETFVYNDRTYAIIELDDSPTGYGAYLIKNGYLQNKKPIPIVENKIRKYNILEDKHMKVFVKTRRGLEQLGEGMLFTKKQISLNEESIYGGRLCSKRQLRLREEFTNGKVSLTLNPNGQDVRASSVQTSAQNMLNQVPQATSVTLQADDVDGVSAPTFAPNDPRNDTVQQLTAKNATSSAIQNAAKNGGTIQITKDDPQQTAMEVKRTSKKIIEMRRNSIPFSKKELSNFLSSL